MIKRINDILCYIYPNLKSFTHQNECRNIYFVLLKMCYIGVEIYSQAAYCFVSFATWLCIVIRDLPCIPHPFGLVFNFFLLSQYAVLILIIHFLYICPSPKYIFFQIQIIYQYIIIFLCWVVVYYLSSIIACNSEDSNLGLLKYHYKH